MKKGKADLNTNNLSIFVIVQKKLMSNILNEEGVGLILYSATFVSLYYMIRLSFLIKMDFYYTLGRYVKTAKSSGK